MTNTIFSIFQARYILDFLSASRSVEHCEFPNTEISSLKMSLQLHVLILAYSDDGSTENKLFPESEPLYCTTPKNKWTVSQDLVPLIK
jgi:hypothetical protein